MADIQTALTDLKQFAQSDLTRRISGLESRLSNRDSLSLKSQLENEQVTESLLNSALNIKQVASQIDVIVHAVGIMVSLPYILEKGYTQSTIGVINSISALSEVPVLFYINRMLRKYGTIKILFLSCFLMFSFYHLFIF